MKKVSDIPTYKIRRNYRNMIQLSDPAATVRSELLRLDLPIKAGQSICVAVGSRGISAIDQITKAVVDFVKERGAHPFIIPAMGSHGGATAEGQKEVLEGFGITEKSMGVPIDASMEVDELPAGGEKCRIFISRVANNSDGIIMINRIKPHTDYHGSYESGLVKMCVIGLGKHAQALEIHRFGVWGLKELLPGAAARIFATGKVLAGVAIVENAVDCPMHIEAIPGNEILAREPELLKTARENMASLPFDNIDVLIVDYIGKDFSGTGLDTNVIGRMRIRGEPEPLRPSIRAIVVRDVSERSHGNALGIGLADVITRRLFEKIDFHKMYENAVTSTFFERVKIPMIAENDAEAVSLAMRYSGIIDEGGERVVRIKNTLELHEMYLSTTLLKEIPESEDVNLLSDALPLCEGENMRPF